VDRKGVGTSAAACSIFRFADDRPACRSIRSRFISRVIPGHGAEASEPTPLSPAPQTPSGTGTSFRIHSASGLRRDTRFRVSRLPPQHRGERELPL
jgi:hypothetical protein